MNRHWIATNVLTLIAGLAVAGCQIHDRMAENDTFPPDARPQSVDRYLDAQAEAGATVDANLHALHFDGASLNALGELKVCKVVCGRGAGPALIYLAMNDDDLAKSRRAVVEKFARGIAGDGRVEVKIGGNPEGFAAAPLIPRQIKTESPQPESSRTNSATPGTGGSSSGFTQNGGK